jgi:hypothetical protein
MTSLKDLKSYKILFIYLFIHSFIGTCTSMALQFFTNGPQRPEQMSITITLQSAPLAQIRLSTVWCVPIRWLFIQVLTVPTMLLRWSNDVTWYRIIWLQMSDVLLQDVIYPSTDRAHCCLISVTGQDRRSQRGTVGHNIRSYLVPSIPIESYKILLRKHDRLWPRWFGPVMIRNHCCATHLTFPLRCQNLPCTPVLCNH